MILFVALAILEKESKGNESGLRDCQQDTGSTSKGTHEVASDGQSANTCTSECSCSWNDTLQFLIHALFTVTGHNKSLFLELLGNISWCRPRNLDPSLGEDCACHDDEGDVDDSVDGVEESICKVQGW